MVAITQPSHLANALASSGHLETSASLLDGVPTELQASLRFSTAQLLQATGILLRLPQELIAQSIVLLHRFWAGPDGGSLLEHDSKVCLIPPPRRTSPDRRWGFEILIWSQDVAAAVLYLAAKPSSTPITPRQVLVVFEYLCALRGDYTAVTDGKLALDDVSTHLSEGKYESGRERLYQTEAHILRVLGFQTQVAHPYTLCVNYLQTLDVFNDAAAGSSVAKRAFAYLNTALLSPQLLYLTHQPSTIATAAIYLAAREVGVKLPETEWWEVFDVDREELGFVVVALLSVEGFAAEEKRKWSQRKVPLTVDELRAEIEHQA